ncbi:MAG TPA: hypothetical protein VKY33_09220 [Flavobacterium sp.]|nr:hypothetical protein [Flavobacterium sp.]
MKLKRLLFVIALSTGFMANAQVSEEASQQLKLEETTQENEPVYRNVEVMARYRGGYEVLLKEIETATKNCKKGKLKKRVKRAEVVAEILVSKIGEVTEVYIIKAEADLCKSEIINALKNTKQWAPARISGRTVNSYLRIRINLENANRNNRKVARFTME